VPAPVYIDLAPDQDITAPLRDQTPPGQAAAKLALGARCKPARRSLGGSASSRRLDQSQYFWNGREAHRWKFVPAGTEGYDKAEVTVGGVDTRELSAKTMEKP